MDSIQLGQLVHQIFTVGKEEGQAIIDKVKTETDDTNLIIELERINNEK